MFEPRIEGVDTKRMIDFKEFQTIFNVGSKARFNKVDILNSFRLNTDDENPEFISIKHLREILYDAGHNEVEQIAMTQHLMEQAVDGRINFETMIDKEFAQNRR